MFACEFCEHFQNNLSAKDLRVTSSYPNLRWVDNTQLKNFLTLSQCRKMVRHTLKILQRMLQDS